MKKYFPFLILFAASVIAAPAATLKLSDGEAAVAEVAESTTPTEAEVKAVEKSDFYKVLDVSTGEVYEVSAEDYIIGAVCAEMPATFEPEALKAQAVAAHTYAERQRLREKNATTPELYGADFSNDTSKYQGYFTINQAKQYFGENFDLNYNKIKSACDEVKDYIITYDDEPIISAFHSMSTGKTESAENVWGTAVDYLVPVDSSFDVSAPKYLDEVKYDKEVLKAKLEAAFSDISMGEDLTKWITVEQKSDSGTVLSTNVGGKTVTGNDLRTALALRSACFDVRYEGDSVIFTTKGYGHCVGMSQYGANSMASAGSTWKEILEHYYPNCKIEKRAD